MAPTDPGRSRIPPNVVVIVLDDVGADKLALFDAGAPAPPYARTPRLDALARGGVRFTNAYANPICSPTRACLQTGRYPFRTGMGGNSEVHLLADSEVLLPRVLKRGPRPQDVYRCGAFGKWHLTPTDLANPAYLTHAVRGGYDRFHGTLDNASDHFRWTKVEHDHGAEPRLVPVAGRWSADVVRSDAASWIRARSLAHPFFAYVAFNPPHHRFQVPAFATDDGRALLSPETRAELGAAQPGDDPPTNAHNELFYRAALEAVDAEIGHLLDDIQLRLGHTMVFVIGDNGTPLRAINGPHDPRHGKTTFYQHGVRVPLIVAGPLVGKPVPADGHVCTALVDAVDLWTTIARIAGVPAESAPQVDGVNALPLLRNPAASGARSWSFAQLFSPPGAYASAVDLASHGRSLTNGTYKYIRSLRGHVPGDPTLAYTHELYHVLDDPEETHDFVVAGFTPEASAAYAYLSAQMDLLSEFG